MSKTAVILGVSGQDGAYLSAYLLNRGYRVVGTTRNKSESSTPRLAKLGVTSRVDIQTLNAENPDKVIDLIRFVKPDEIYNLCGPSSVAESFVRPDEAIHSITSTATNCLEGIRKINKKIKYYNACTSECFGETKDLLADESTKFHPRSPYGSAKAAVFELVRHYRENYDLFASSGIAFNHESPLRTNRFVMQKIIVGAKDIAEKKIPYLELGELDVARDWGWAPEFVSAMYKILQHEIPDDFVLATGRSTSLKEVVRMVFHMLDLEWSDYVRTSASYVRPSEIRVSAGCAEKAYEILGWKARTDLESILNKMIFGELY
jgi:GDPmannose 4,6-dehydratase